jgi:HAMP domain-containing protein
MLLNKLKLRTKFNVVLITIFLGGILVSGLSLSWILQERAQMEVTSKALLLLQTMNAVRDYTSDHIQPLLSPKLELESVFISETVPAYSATEVFQKLRKNEEYKSFFYKEATLNPTNLRDKADSFESNLIEQFQKEPNTTEISDFSTLPGGRVFYIARPLTVKQESCLRCHGDPNDAPKSQLATYGAENGYGWKLNQIVAVQILSVPAEEVFNQAHRSVSLVLLTLLGVFSVIVIGINFLLKRTVIHPLQKMAKIAESVSMGNMDSQFEQKTEDEIGTLAKAFNRMKSSLAISIDLLNKHHRG